MVSAMNRQKNQKMIWYILIKNYSLRQWFHVIMESLFLFYMREKVMVMITDICVHNRRQRAIEKGSDSMFP